MALRRITYIAEELDVSVPRAYALVREAAAYCGLSPRTLEKLRLAGNGQ